MKDLIQKIEHWAIERNLIEGSTPQKQMLKLMEEFGELCGGIAKNNLNTIKDSIGDCFVVMVILSNQIDVGDYVDFDADDIIQEYLDGKYSHTNVTEQLLEGIHSLGGLSLPINQGWKAQEEYIELFFINLVLTALFNGFNFRECVQHAYNQIKDRKGRMIDGVWVKKEDLQNE